MSTAELAKLHEADLQGTYCVQSQVCSISSLHKYSNKFPFLTHLCVSAYEILHLLLWGLEIVTFDLF